MKIYEIGTGYTPIPAQIAAATESVVEELTRAYLNMGKDVEIIDISSSCRAEHNLPITQVRVPSVFTKSDVSLGIIHKLKRVVYSVFLAFKLKKILKNLKEKAIFHFHNQYNLFFFTKIVPQKLREKAVVAYTNHNGLWSKEWDDVKDVLHSRYFQEIAAMKSADKVFVLNEKTKENVIKHLEIDDKKVVVIRNGVNTDVYKPLDEKEILKIKEKHNLTDKKVILQVGSVYENKGQARVVEMLAPLLKENDNLVYAYVGGIVSQEYFDRVKMAADENFVSDKTIYLGTVSPGKEMNEIYNIADATVFASEYEGFPLVCVESVSTGVPVMLCTDTAVNIGDGSVVATQANIVSCIRDSILNNPDEYKILRVLARENAVKNYSWQGIALEYMTKAEAD
ncbi:MAG: glycosyltransferase family 4 protein [Clostridia bacterium]|nr:glycosyltransferase family 4 protein [Clostridia bacterium]